MAKDNKTPDNDEPVISKQVFVDRSGETAFSRLDIDASVDSKSGEQDIFPDTLPRALVDGTAILLYMGDEQNIYIPRGITEIKSGAFSNMLGNIETVIMPEGVRVIGEDAFSMQMKLSKVVLPASLESIGRSCFDFCGALKEVHYNGTVQQWRAVKKDPAWGGGLRFTPIRVICSDGVVEDKQ